MNIAIVGTGYVGLVSGTCFAEMGAHVTCVDVDTQKIQKLKDGIMPIYEPGLEELVKRNVGFGRLSFTTDLTEVLDDVEVVFSAVGTPPDEDGSADLKYVLAVAKKFGQCINKYTILVTKSTVPVGTAKKVKAAFLMHRTPLSCISLLEVFKRSFDDNPVNRTAMIQRLLSIIFDNEAVPTYKSLPDVKDCEFVLGYICEKIIRAEEYYFKEEDFYSAASTFCKEQKITLDYRYLFTILLNNQIICEYDSHWFGFRFSFWVYYFAAMRMTKSEEFAAFILEKKNYAHYPEVMEFYTGSDRTRNDAAQIVINDILEVTKKVEEKVGIPADVNPFQRLKINNQHDEQQVDRIIQQLDDNLQKSKLPDKIKDALVDRHYNPSRPFHQEVYKVMNNYSVNYLQEMIAIASKTMRNSDYIKPELKDQLFDSITDAWLNTIRVIYLMAPALAQRGVAGYDGFSLQLDETFDKEGDSIQDKLIQIIASIPLNILNWYKDNIYTAKLAQLVYNKITDSSGPVIKHILIGIVINEQPDGWTDVVQKYLTDVDRNSYYFGNTIDMLLSKWQFDSTMSEKNTVQTKNLILASYAKLYSNSNNFSLANVKRIKTSVLPERAKDEDEKQ